MPIELEKKLRATAKKRHYGKERTERYVFGAMLRRGWRKPKKSRKAI